MGGPVIWEDQQCGRTAEQVVRHVVGRAVLDTGSTQLGSTQLLLLSLFLFSSHPLPFPFLLLISGQNKYLTILFDLEKDVDVNHMVTN